MRSNPIHPAELGGTLFVPATHPQLASVVSGTKYPSLRSVVIDTEDGIDAGELPAATARIRTLLPALQPAPLLRFIRPASPRVLETLLAMESIGNIDGFVLPKFGLENADAWLAPLWAEPFAFMPSIEGPDLFSQEKLDELSEILNPFQKRIPTIRFGLEDMLRQLGMARDCAVPLYSLAAPAHVIAMLITAFKPRGFNVSGGVYTCYEDTQGFRDEVEADLRQGLLGKTLIHPAQIAVVEAVYKVSAREKERADAIVSASTNVSSRHGMMLEKPTQRAWAESILRRAALYGVKP